MREYIKGDKELISKLQRLKSKDAKAAIRKGSRAGAKIVQAAAKSLAPKLSGNLARGIKVRALPRSRKWVGATIRLEVPYAAFIEFGLTKHKLAAQHFLENAAKQSKDSAVGVALESIKTEIEAKLV